MTLVTGAGSPVTVAAHGLGMTVEETRPLLSGVPGTKVFPAAHGCTYADLAGDLLAVADAHGASQALGVSMGAGALLRILSEHPARFDRVVLFLPAVLSTPRDFQRPADPVEAVRAELPAEATDAYVQERVRRLADPAVQRMAHGLGGDVAVTGSLEAVTADVLVVAQDGDPLHPAAVAREVAAALPRAALHVFERPGVLWWGRRELRALVAPFLSP